MIRRLLHAAAVPCVIATLSQCDAVHNATHKSWAFLSLEQALATSYPKRDVFIAEEGAVVAIWFRNAPEGSLPAADRASFARGVALFVRDHYVDYDDIDTVRVGFVSMSDSVPPTVMQRGEPYSYSKAELGPAPAPAPAPASAATHDTARRGAAAAAAPKG